MKELSLLSRYQGTLLGVGVGDALGAPFETQSGQEVTAAIEARGGLTYIDYIDPFRKDLNWKAGRPTDDSELTAALAMSLIDCRGSDLADQYRRYRAIVHGDKRSVLYDGPAEGFGGTTKKMLLPETYELSRQMPNPPTIPTNGSLMRTAPLALMLYKDAEYPDGLVRIAREVSAVTHLNPIAGDVCIVCCDILQQLLDGDDPVDAVTTAFLCPFNDMHFVPEVEALGRVILTEPPPTPERKTWGGAIYSLHVAVWALLNAQSFSDGIEKSICLGGDTDTYAAIAGGLLGAHFGAESIPKDWKDGYLGTQKMLALATQLYEMTQLQKAA